MKWPRLMIPVAAMLLMVGCHTGPNLQTVQRMTLQCKADEGECFGFCSFSAGMLTSPVDPAQVDLLYYFDGDDCRHGALIGHDDRPGYLFPIGKKSWSELAMLAPPAEDTDSVAGIRPLDKDKEGLAFWVKRSDGEYILARIRTVHPVSYEELASGGTATLELEWSRPSSRE